MKLFSSKGSFLDVVAMVFVVRSPVSTHRPGKWNRVDRSCVRVSICCCYHYRHCWYNSVMTEKKRWQGSVSAAHQAKTVYWFELTPRAKDVTHDSVYAFNTTNTRLQLTLFPVMCSLGSSDFHSHGKWKLMPQSSEASVTCDQLCLSWCKHHWLQCCVACVVCETWDKFHGSKMLLLLSQHSTGHSNAWCQQSLHCMVALGWSFHRIPSAGQRDPIHKKHVSKSAASCWACHINSPLAGKSFCMFDNKGFSLCHAPAEWLHVFSPTLLLLCHKQQVNSCQWQSLSHFVSKRPSTWEPPEAWNLPCWESFACNALCIAQCFCPFGHLWDTIWQVQIHSSSSAQASPGFFPPKFCNLKNVNDGHQAFLFSDALPSLQLCVIDSFSWCFSLWNRLHHVIWLCHHWCFCHGQNNF